MLALPPRAKKKPPAQQMQQDQQQVSSPVALQMQKQPVQQQGMPARPPGAPPTPPRETAPPSSGGGMVKAMGGPGAVRSTGFLGGVKVIDQGPATQDAFRDAGRGSIAVRPDVVKSKGVQDAEESFGSERNLEEWRSEGARQSEIDRQKQLEAERIAAEEAAREEAAKQQQQEESVFDDVDKNVSNDTLDQQIRGLIENLVSGKGASTESEEALIKQLMEDRIGAGLVEQRARMGRAGFGASGALAAMEGDVRRQAAQGATQETLAVRRQAEQDAINRALEAIGVDVAKRKQAGDELYQQEFLNALNSQIEQENAARGIYGEQDPEKLQQNADRLEERLNAYQSFVGTNDPSQQAQKVMDLPVGEPGPNSELVRSDTDNPRDTYSGPDVYYDYETKQLFRTE